MALVGCKECGKEISDKAPACPHCGAKIKRSSFAANGCLVIVILLVALPFVVKIFGSNDVGPSTLPEIGDRYTVSRDAFACQDEDYVKKIASASKDNDSQAASLGIFAGVDSGGCVIVKVGDVFEIKDVHVFSGLVQIRKIGDLSEYWMYQDRVDLATKE